MGTDSCTTPYTWSLLYSAYTASLFLSVTHAVSSHTDWNSKMESGIKSLLGSARDSSIDPCM